MGTKSADFSSIESSGNKLEIVSRHSVYLKTPPFACCFCALRLAAKPETTTTKRRFCRKSKQMKEEGKSRSKNNGNGKIETNTNGWNVAVHPFLSGTPSPDLSAQPFKPMKKNSNSNSPSSPPLFSLKDFCVFYITRILSRSPFRDY